MIALDRPNINDEGVPIVNGKTAWLQTSSGRKVSLPVPKKEEIDVVDIAVALAKQCRFNGHCKSFYSVAQHSVLGVKVAQFLGFSKAVQKEFILHDATEAYLGDVIRPVKRQLSVFQDMEQVFWGTISAKFGLPYVHSPEVHDLDNIMLVWEKQQLLPNSTSWDNLPDISKLDLQRNIGNLVGWPWKKAEAEFLKTYYELFGGLR